MDNFNKALRFVLAREGGISNNKNDSGGLTNHGITQSTYNTYREANKKSIQSVTGITYSEVSDIYLKNFYEASGADKIVDFKLSLMVFDTAVNMGVSIAKLLLKNSHGDFDRFYNLRLADYKAIVRNNPKDAEFLNGWENRLELLKNYT